MHCTVVVKGIKGWKGLDDPKIALSWDSCHSQSLGIGWEGQLMIPKLFCP